MPQPKDRPRLPISEVRHILRFEWDPIGVGSFPAAMSVSIDEYDCCLMPVLRMQREGASAESIAAFLLGELRTHFALAVSPGLKARTERTAAKLASMGRVEQL